MSDNTSLNIIQQFDLRGKLCPYCVMSIIREADLLEEGQTLEFLVDDPLALKSVPEELQECDEFCISINEIEGGWSIIITRQ